MFALTVKLIPNGLEAYPSFFVLLCWHRPDFFHSASTHPNPWRFSSILWLGRQYSNAGLCFLNQNNFLIEILLSFAVYLGLLCFFGIDDDVGCGFKALPDVIGYF
jgi:hypothetical protein